MNATDHTCAWRDEVLELREALKARDAVIAEHADLRAQLEARDVTITEYVATQVQQAAHLENIQGQLSALQHRVFGGGRDKMPSPAEALKKAKAPRHDRASELDLWDCIDVLVEEEDFSQAMAE